MDYLDTRKQYLNSVLLFVGYILVAIAIVIGTLVLLYQAYGFSLGKNGTVIQNGLTFFSSHPSPAKIYLNGQLESVTTNSRLILPAGVYHVRLARDGYREWQRTIELEGGSVEHFDYPFLFPKALTGKKIRTYNGAPGLSSQSPDHRWLLVEDPGSIITFGVYDLKNPDRPPIGLTLPANLLTKANANEGWQFDQWADDNQHVLLQHNFDGRTEFILLDRANPEKSLNLNSSLSQNPLKLTLKDKKYDQYYIYDTAGTLQTVSLSAPVKPLLNHVLAYQSYGTDTLLYATPDGAKAGTVWIKLLFRGHTYNIRNLPAGTNYLVDLTTYSGTMYVAAGDTADNKVSIFKDPVGQLSAQPGHAVVPSQVLHVPQPNYLSFSPTAQFVMVSNANYFGVYDIENDKGYNYTAPEPLDPPQSHAAWMDGNRLIYVSGGQLVVFDYDGRNHQKLVAAGSQYLPAFAPDYKTLFTLTPNGGQTDLGLTYLLTPADR